MPVLQLPQGLWLRALWMLLVWGFALERDRQLLL
jgi:hypothetical protein